MNETMGNKHLELTCTRSVSLLAKHDHALSPSSTQKERGTSNSQENQGKIIKDKIL